MKKKEEDANRDKNNGDKDIDEDKNFEVQDFNVTEFYFFRI